VIGKTDREGTEVIAATAESGEAALENVSERLTRSARRWPQQRAVVVAVGRGTYRSITFAELEGEVVRLAAGLTQIGIRPGHRIVLMVRPGIEFIALTFALLRIGAVLVLIDPGMGRTNIFQCLDEIEPDGYVAIPVVQLMRLWKGRSPAFRSAKFNVTVGPGWPGLGMSYRKLLWRGGQVAPGQDRSSCAVGGSAPAAIIFTSGSTGPPKGVRYEHGMFCAQVDLIQSMYAIEPGEADLPGFPLFGLFNAAMGVTTVVPEMDPTRPADVDPEKILASIRANQVTQAFGSPAFWNRVGRFCDERGIELPGIRRALSAGGPVPTHVLERMSRVLTGPGADLFTPYGATESLPVASIGAREVLASTAARTRAGGGTCVGRPFPDVEIRIVPITDGAIAHIEDVIPLPTGEIGEIIVRGPSVTREYESRAEATTLAKIADSRPLRGESRPSVWHRIGDVGCLDDQGRLWFCGRKAHIVETPQGRMFSVCCEAIFENHPRVYRAALVGLGTPGAEAPVIIVEPEAGQWPSTGADEARFREELLAIAASSPLTSSIRDVRFHRSLPVDTRHNVKIQREALRAWAAEGA
jgi:acyl-CoA synthetase (AMP-forming)/AMP-acid ligase II